MTSENQQREYLDIVRMVSAWPAALRLRLVRMVLDTLDLEGAPPEHRIEGPAKGARHGHTLEQARGLLTTDQPPPSDEDVARWLDEYRMQKYG